MKKERSLLRRLWAWFIRTFFDLLYGPFAWTYDVVAWSVSLGQWKAWGRTALRFLTGTRVLELGHGPGHIQVALAKDGGHPVGLDRSPQMGRLARRRLLREGQAPQLVRAHTQAIPFRSGAFSDVVATFPTEYIIDPRTSREIERVLEPEGQLVIVAAAHLAGSDLISRLLEWLYRITGQREPVPRGDEEAWTGGRLTMESQWIEARYSRVLVITGKKTAADARRNDTSGCTSSPPSEARTVPETASAEGSTRRSAHW